MNEAVAEAVFFLVILKIPIVYLCLVVWYAIRATPLPPEGAVRPVEPADDAPGPSRSRERRPRPPSGRRPHGAPTRTYARRGAFARGRVGRS